jgi:methylmalonyl-CoA mutase cobalamin-binding subunit
MEAGHYVRMVLEFDPQNVAPLQALGVAAVFPFGTPLADIVRFIEEAVR